MAKDVRIRSVDLNASTWPSSRLSRSTTFGAGDRFAKVGTVVTELYSEHLRTGEPLRAGAWWVRFLPANDRTPSPLTGPGVTPDLGLGEVLDAHFDPAVLDLPDAERRAAVLEWLQDHMLRLARGRGWDEAPVHAAYQGCLDAGLRVELATPSKSSRDRKHRAWVSFTIDGEGDGWSRLHVAGPSGEAATDPAYSYPTLKSGRRMLRTLRWLDSRTAAYRPWIYDDEPPEPTWTDRLVTLSVDGAAGEVPIGRQP